MCQFGPKTTLKIWFQVITQIFYSSLQSPSYIKGRCCTHLTSIWAHQPRMSFTASDQMLPSDPGNAFVSWPTDHMAPGNRESERYPDHLDQSHVSCHVRPLLSQWQALCLILFCWQSNFLQSINGLFYLFNTTNLALWVSRCTRWSAVAAERAPCTGQGRAQQDDLSFDWYQTIW